MRRAFRYSKITALSSKRQTQKSRNRFIYTIIGTVALIYLIITWLLPNLIGGLSVLTTRKNQSKKELSVAEGVVLAPPDLSIPYESTNTAVIAISGNSSPHSKVEIYINNKLQDSTQTDESGSFKSNSVPLALGDNTIYGKTTDDKGHKSLPSKEITVVFDNSAPKLTVTSPDDNLVITTGDKNIKVAGQTDSDNTTLSINGTRVIVNSDGNFLQIIPLSDGDNQISIKAVNHAGNVTEVKRKITYQTTNTPTPTPTSGDSNH